MATRNTKKRLASEKLTLDTAKSKLESNEAWLHQILIRLDIYLPEKPLKVLDVGCAQGRMLIGLDKLGHRAFGVEPQQEAIDVAQELAQQNKSNIVIKKGWAESIPYDDNTFDLVIATSVMEHVTDIDKSLQEIYRVVKPNGIFWFNSASAMSPMQNEIGAFPFFGWYPNNLKLRIMYWAKKNHPELIGYTDAPAIHWWTEKKARRMLREVGFVHVWNRWELRAPHTSGWKGLVIKLAQRYGFVRIILDIVVPGCSFAARKPPASV